eukprot:364429-Chlamydomonas_euryale.AAC.28
MLRDHNGTARGGPAVPVADMRLTYDRGLIADGDFEGRSPMEVWEAWMRDAAESKAVWETWMASLRCRCGRHVGEYGGTANTPACNTMHTLKAVPQTRPPAC